MVTMPRSPTQLDHVVLLLPYRDIVNPPDWITKNFTISPGGKHADGRTENRLIMFKDGTYLELIAFINDDPEKRKGHWWDRAFGVIDFALTTRSREVDFAGLQGRLEDSGSDIRYKQPIEGGRITDQRKELKWKVTFPEDTVTRGMVPFWCHDVTPREWRVPAIDGNTHHPCGAVGMDGIVIEIVNDQVGRIDRALGAITEEGRKGKNAFPTGTPFDIGRTQGPTIEVKEQYSSGELDQGVRLTLVLQSPAKDGLPDIEQKIGDGKVSIRFVQ